MILRQPQLLDRSQAIRNFLNLSRLSPEAFAVEQFEYQAHKADFIRFYDVDNVEVIENNIYHTEDEEETEDDDAESERYSTMLSNSAVDGSNIKRSDYEALLMSDLTSLKSKLENSSIDIESTNGQQDVPFASTVAIGSGSGSGDNDELESDDEHETLSDVVPVVVIATADITSNNHVSDDSVELDQAPTISTTSSTSSSSSTSIVSKPPSQVQTVQLTSTSSSSPWSVSVAALRDAGLISDSIAANTPKPDVIPAPTTTTTTRIVSMGSSRPSTLSILHHGAGDAIVHSAATSDVFGSDNMVQPLPSSAAHARLPLPLPSLPIICIAKDSKRVELGRTTVESGDDPMLAMLLAAGKQSSVDNV